MKLGDYISHSKEPIEDQKVNAYDTKGEDPTMPEADDFECYEEYISSKVPLNQYGKHIH